MARLQNFFIYWFPPLLWMALIFYFSSRPRFDITEKYIVNFVVFKSLHIIEYGFLYFLLFRAIHKTTKLPVKKQLIAAFLMAFFYGVIDEIHQTFVPTREGKLRDVIIDTIGIAAAFFLIKGNVNFVKRYF